MGKMGQNPMVPDPANGHMKDAYISPVISF